MSAEIAGVERAEGEEVAVAIERELGLHREVARVVVAQEALMAIERALHRPADAARRPCRQRVLGIEVIARAVVAAELARHYAHRALGHAEDGGEIGAMALHPARGGVDRVAPAFIGRDGHARLERYAGDPIQLRLQAHDVRGTRKSGGDGGRIAKLVVDAGIDRRIESLVVDLDALSRVPSNGARLCNDHGDGFADEARLVRRQRGKRREAALQRHLVGIG